LDAEAVKWIAAIVFAFLLSVSALQAVSEMTRSRIRTTVKHRLSVAGIRYKILDVDRDGMCTLDLSRSGVTDLSPLAGLPIKVLNVSFCGVHDLTPLKAMPLVGLNVWATPVRDLSPLKGAPLTMLNVNHCRNLTDLSPLKGMALKELHFAYTQVKDLSPLTELPLRDVSCSMTPVNDLTPLKGISLVSLSFTPERITTGMEIVREMSTLERIESLGDKSGRSVGYTPAAKFWADHAVRQVLKVKGLPYREFKADRDGRYVLDLSRTDIRDLAPLKGLPLKWLDINRTHVTNLSALAGMPLSYLDLSKTPVTDLSPLQGMTLEDIRFSPDRVKTGIDTIRRMRSLVRIGTHSKHAEHPIQFWRKYDTGFFE